MGGRLTLPRAIQCNNCHRVLQEDDKVPCTQAATETQLLHYFSSPVLSCGYPISLRTELPGYEEYIDQGATRYHVQPLLQVAACHPQDSGLEGELHEHQGRHLSLLSAPFNAVTDHIPGQPGLPPHVPKAATGPNLDKPPTAVPSSKKNQEKINIDSVPPGFDPFEDDIDCDTNVALGTNKILFDKHC